MILKKYLLVDNRLDDWKMCKSTNRALNLD